MIIGERAADLLQTKQIGQVRETHLDLIVA
jgi:hypothetical protein